MALQISGRNGRLRHSSGDSGLNLFTESHHPPVQIELRNAAILSHHVRHRERPLVAHSNLGTRIAEKEVLRHKKLTKIRRLPAAHKPCGSLSLTILSPTQACMGEAGRGTRGHTFASPRVRMHVLCITASQTASTPSCPNELCPRSSKVRLSCLAKAWQRVLTVSTRSPESKSESESSESVACVECASLSFPGQTCKSG